jgi:hypothetical protein
MYSQLSSIAGSRPSVLNPMMRHAAVTRDLPNMDGSLSTQHTVINMNKHQKLAVIKKFA